MLVITIEFIENENLKTKVYKSKTNKKPYCSVPKNRPNYVDSQSHKKYL